MSQRTVPSPPVVAIGALLVAAGLYLTWLASHLWFMLDDFAFLLHRRLTFSGDHALLMPHNDHWVTLPIVIYRVLFHLVGLHHYLPYALVTIGLHVVTALLLAVMFLRSGADPWVCVVMTALVAFMGAGAMDILWDFQMVFVGPTALALGCMVLLDRGEQVPRYPVAVWALLAAALMFSGAGVSMVAWVAAYAMLRRGPRQAVKVALPPTVFYGVWYLFYGIGTSPAPPVPPGRIVPYMLRGMTNLWDQVLPVPWLGTVVLVLITVVTLRARGRTRLRIFAGAGLLGLLFHFLLLAVSRGGWGMGTSTSTRYLYLGVLLTLPAVGLTLQVAWDRLARFPLPRALGFAVLGLVFVAAGARLFHHQAAQQEVFVEGLRERVVAASLMVEQGAPAISTQPEPIVAPDIDTTSLARADIRSSLPRLSPSRRTFLEVASRLEVAVSTARLDLPLATGVRVQRMAPVSKEGSCRTFVAKAGATVKLPAMGTGSQIRLTVSQGRIQTQLLEGRRASARLRSDVPVGKPVYVGVSAVGGRLLVTVPSGDVTVCAAGSVSPGG